jgi:excisionase family DNA binding protein
MEKTMTDASVQRAVKAAEAATLLGISRRFLAQLTREGKLASHRYGPRTVTYDVGEIERFKAATLIGNNQAGHDNPGEKI